MKAPCLPGSTPYNRPCPPASCIAFPGTVVQSVDAVGKHLIVAFDDGAALRTHLGMAGSWQVYRPGERWRRAPYLARVVIETADAVAVCFAAPTVELLSQRTLAEAL